MKYCLYTDGAARGNPGPGGAGVCLTDENNVVVAVGSRYLGEVTNNVAEYKALILGLKLAKRYQVVELQILSDSELMVRQIQGKYRVKNEQLKKIYNQVMKLLKDFKYQISHIGREKNKVADKLANEALDQKFERLGR